MSASSACPVGQDACGRANRAQSVLLRIRERLDDDERVLVDVIRGLAFRLDVAELELRRANERIFDLEEKARG